MKVLPLLIAVIILTQPGKGSLIGLKLLLGKALAGKFARIFETHQTNVVPRALQLTKLILANVDTFVDPETEFRYLNDKETLIYATQHDFDSIGEPTADPLQAENDSSYEMRNQSNTTTDINEMTQLDYEK